MSYHATVNCHTCGEILNHGHDSLPYGLKPLFDELGCPILDWNGRTGVAVLPQLQSAVTTLEDEICRDDIVRRHQKDDDEWDRVGFALPFLRSMRDAICRDPYATVGVH